MAAYLTPDCRSTIPKMQKAIPSICGTLKIFSLKKTAPTPVSKIIPRLKVTGPAVDTGIILRSIIYRPPHIT